MSERVATRDVSSGVVHVRIRDGDRLLVDERCNLDDAGEYELVTDVELDEIPMAERCRNCYPHPDDAGGAAEDDPGGTVPSL